MLERLKAMRAELDAIIAQLEGGKDIDIKPMLTGIDYAVHIDGEHRATFVKVGETTWSLHAVGKGPTRLSCRRTGFLECVKKAIDERRI